MTADALRRLPIFGKIYRQIENRPKPLVEESWPLRLWVQVLVAVGIVATDIAADTRISLWAVPVSFLGGYWSWRQRHRANVPTQFAIAVGMLIALGAFFGRLIASLGDTRLVLAELLIHLQVLHSFDLPRRKDLGYSMVIGLILLGVAGTLSQTLWYAPTLLAFLAVILPVLMLDYRSQLGLGDRPLGSQLQTYLAPRRLGAMLAIVAVLGLVLFAVMPRFPGYQLRQFPVSGSVDLRNQTFDQQEDSRGIVNPGYDEDGDGIAGGADGRGGQMDETFYYGFSSRINQNLQGELTPQLVMRVRSQSPGFWRVLGFDHYTGQGWEISRNDQPLNLRRPGWSYRFLLPSRPGDARTRDVIQSYTVVSTLPNLVPALAQPQEIYFPTRELAVDPEGGLRSPRLLEDGLTYTVISQVPYRDRTALRSASTAYSEGIRTHYLEVPPEIRDRLRRHAEALLAKADPPRTDPYEQSLYLAQALKQNYRIRTDINLLDSGQDLATAFLFDREGGYPDHFATTLTLLLRSLGIPARLAVGFAPGRFNPFTGLYEVYNTDAHAITEVYFPDYGWFAFDPIPGHPLIPPSIEENQTFDTLRQLWSWVAGWLPAPLRSWLSGVINWVLLALVRSLNWLAAWFGRGWLGAVMGSLILIGVAFGLWLLWQAIAAWRYRRQLAKLPPVEALYRQVVDWLGDREDWPKRPTQTPWEYVRWCEAAAARDPAAGRSQRLALLSTVSDAYARWHYGGQAIDPAPLRQQWHQVRRQDRGTWPWLGHGNGRSRRRPRHHP